MHQSAISIVVFKLLYELNPSLWGNAAAGAEDDTPPDGAIEDYLAWVERDEELN